MTRASSRGRGGSGVRRGCDQLWGSCPPPPPGEDLPPPMVGGPSAAAELRSCMRGSMGSSSFWKSGMRAVTPSTSSGLLTVAASALETRPSGRASPFSSASSIFRVSSSASAARLAASFSARMTFHTSCRSM